jgi:D-alanyl-D-alanine carboxypeptidase/D-alanyl-D-alanine-endopeptidase (penicillin-binding protein 4)
MRCRVLVLCVLRVLCISALAAAAQAQDALPPAVRAALAQAGVPEDALAAVALPLGPVPRAAPWRHQAARPMQPASTMKVVTAIVAIDRLGPDLRGSTEFRSAAPLQDGVLQGDLVLKGGNDPDLELPQFWALLVDLRQAGVRRIEGDLVLDRTLFNPPRPDLGVPPFDEAPEFAYNVIPDALQLAGNLLPLQLSADAQSLAAAVVPPLPGLDIDASHVALTDRPCKDWDEDWLPARVSHDAGRTRIELQGGFPRGCARRTGLQLIDRNELAERLFAALWGELGGSWQGRVREAAAGTDAVATRLLARRESRAWGEVLRSTMKESDNPHTRMLYLQLGVAAARPGEPTAQAAAREVRAWLAEHRIDDAGLVLDNGSGLSRSERITPWQLASMLKTAWGGRRASELVMSLPVAGEDGTLRRRYQASPAAGWARLKTGTLRNVVALAGYVYDPQGRPWAVSMMINHEAAQAARPALDALVDALARRGLRDARATPSFRPCGHGGAQPCPARAPAAAARRD